MTGRPDDQRDHRLRFLQEQLEDHAQIAEDLVEIADHTRAVPGSIVVDGEVIMAEFDTQDEAKAALRELFESEHLPPAS